LPKKSEQVAEQRKDWIDTEMLLRSGITVKREWLLLNTRQGHLAKGACATELLDLARRIPRWLLEQIGEVWALRFS